MPAFSWILKRLPGSRSSSSNMAGLHTHLDHFYELLDDEAAAGSADPFQSAMRALSVCMRRQPRPPRLHVDFASDLPCMISDVPRAAAAADSGLLQFVDELGLGAFIAREVRVSAPEWERLHAEVKQPFSPAQVVAPAAAVSVSPARLRAGREGRRVADGFS